MNGVIRNPLRLEVLSLNPLQTTPMESILPLTKLVYNPVAPMLSTDREGREAEIGSAERILD